jgi:hypothetical protein
MLRNGLPNNEKHNASKIVLLPSPFLPMIRVV